MGSSSFGPARYGQPTAVVAPTYQTDPSKYQAFDTSNLADRAMAGVGQDAARQQQLVGAKLAQMGGGRSAGGARQMMDVQAGAMNRAGDIRNQMAQTSFNQQLQQMANQNQWNLGEQQNQQKSYEDSAALNEQERDKRQGVISKMFGQYGDVANLFQ